MEPATPMKGHFQRQKPYSNKWEPTGCPSLYNKTSYAFITEPQNQWLNLKKSLTSERISFPQIPTPHKSMVLLCKQEKNGLEVYNDTHCKVILSDRQCWCNITWLNLDTFQWAPCRSLITLSTWCEITGSQSCFFSCSILIFSKHLGYICSVTHMCWETKTGACLPWNLKATNTEQPKTPNLY